MLSSNNMIIGHNMGNRKSKPHQIEIELEANSDLTLQDIDINPSNIDKSYLERQNALQRAYHNNDILTIIILESYQRAPQKSL